jgi:uncharacterized protein (TIGR03435 family)
MTYRDLLLAAGGIACLWAQPPMFDVASVKLSDPNARIGTVEILPGGRFTAANVPLRVVILRAYDVRDFQLSGPAWLNERYAIQAKAPEGSFSEAQIWMMVQGLLAERLHLKVHRETKELPVYALVVGKSGSKVQAAKDEGGMGVGRGSITAKGSTFAKLAIALSRLLDRPVLDETGLSGNFDFKLHYDQGSVGLPYSAPGVSRPESDGIEPSIFTAVQEQLGLKLEPQKKAIEGLVIDSIERPSGN